MATFLTTLKTGRRTGRAEGGAVTAMYLGERLWYNTILEMCVKLGPGKCGDEHAGQHPARH